VTSGAENQSGSSEAEFVLAALESTSIAKTISEQEFPTRIILGLHDSEPKEMRLITSNMKKYRPK